MIRLATRLFLPLLGALVIAGSSISALANPGATGQAPSVATLDTTKSGAALDAQGAAADEELPRILERSFVASVVGAPNAAPLAGQELERRTHDVGLLLRCPVCQGSSVADSPSSTAINMKNEVRDLLAQGYDQGQILAWFEASYGQFVLMQPKAEGLNLLVWLGPWALLVLGLFLVLRQLRKLGKGDDTIADLADDDPARGSPALTSHNGAARHPDTSSKGDQHIHTTAADALPHDPDLEEYLREVRALAYGEGSGDSKPHGPPTADGTKEGS